MLSKLFKSPATQLISIIEKDRLTDLKGVTGKLSSSDIDSCNALQKATELARVSILEQLLKLYPESAKKSAEELIAIALQNPESLALLTTLFKGGVSANTEVNGKPAILHTRHLNNDQLMLHLNRFNQFGISLSEHPELLSDALQKENRPLIKLLIDSGVEPLPNQLSELNSELRDYTERLLSDKKLRDSWL
jgi:hypothetical protein